jgi:hypothetical protein
MKKAIKVGQVITLKDDAEWAAFRMFTNVGASFQHIRGADLTHPRVRVLQISFNRRELNANKVWLEVQQVNEATRRGWIPFDCGGWDQGKRLRITELSFEDTRPESAKPDMSCT